MKKIAMLVLFFVLSVFMKIPVFADGNIEGYIYSTDILAYVNGKPINSYNIGGRTVVIAEELNGYGFDHTYDDESRTLRVKSYFNRGSESFEEIPRGKVGKVMGNIYTTDITVYFNGIPVKGYNIGGRTAICLEDIGDISVGANSKYGYSEYLGKAVWDGEKRIISFESYIRNEGEILGVSRVYHRFVDNVIYTYADDFMARSDFVPSEENEMGSVYTYSPGTGSSRFVIKPLYFDNHGELTEVGFCVANPNATVDDALIHIENPEFVRNMIKTFKNPQKTHDEAMEYFSETGKIIKQIENEKYTVLMTEHDTEGLLFVYINKQGGFVVENFYSGYADRQVDVWFDEVSGNIKPNTVVHSVYPFGGPHGITTAHFVSELDGFDYE